MEIIISGKNKKSLQLVESLARRLGLTIRKSVSGEETTETKPDAESLYELMTEMAESDGIESIKDPLAWQKDIRRDNPLF